MSVGSPRHLKNMAFKCAPHTPAFRGTPCPRKRGATEMGASLAVFSGPCPRKRRAIGSAPHPGIPGHTPAFPVALLPAAGSGGGHRRA